MTLTKYLNRLSEVKTWIIFFKKLLDKLLLNKWVEWDVECKVAEWVTLLFTFNLLVDLAKVLVLALSEDLNKDAKIDKMLLMKKKTMGQYFTQEIEVTNKNKIMEAFTY